MSLVSPRAARLALLALASLHAAACARPATAPRPGGAPVPSPTIDPAALAQAVIPAPSRIEVNAAPAERFTIDTTVVVTVPAGASDEVTRIARGLATLIGLRGDSAVRAADAVAAGTRTIALRLDPSSAAHGGEGYAIDATRDAVTLVAATPAGLFHAVQTLRQLMPWSVEHAAAYQRRLWIPAARVEDVPRFAWRGAMLDVSRHFLSADDVRRYIDAIALYKLNRLHLHLSDDQGWRIEIRSWPKLARHGGSTEVGGGGGGYYTQEEFRDLVRYAAERYITVVPEIDMPGHTNAALASYPELNCDGQARPLYTGIRVGFSALCVERDTTYAFVRDVVREIAALDPDGRWFHIGGDEVEKLTHPQYIAFIERVQGIVRDAGREMIGWGEIAPARLDGSTIVQHWRRDSSAVHAARGGRIVLSPGPKLYIDMKYDSTTVLGLRWAGLVSVRTTYDWEPASYLAGVGESSILGVEAPLWSETLEKREDFEFMAFPRLLALSELGWSRADRRSWDDFRLRLAAHGPRLQAMGVNFYRSPEVPWVVR